MEEFEQLLNNINVKMDEPQVKQGGPVISKVLENMLVILNPDASWKYGQVISLTDGTRAVVLSLLEKTAYALVIDNDASVYNLEGTSLSAIQNES